LPARPADAPRRSDRRGAGSSRSAAGRDDGAVTA